MFSEFTLTLTWTTENTVEKETVKIAANPSTCLSAPKAKKKLITLTKSYAWKLLSLRFFQLFFSCYVSILEQGSKIHGEKSQSQPAGQFPIFFGLCWSVLILISLTLYWRALLVLAPVLQRLDNAIHRINRYPADRCWQNKPRYPPVDSVIHFSNNRDL